MHRRARASQPARQPAVLGALVATAAGVLGVCDKVSWHSAFERRGTDTVRRGLAASRQYLEHPRALGASSPARSRVAHVR